MKISATIIVRNEEHNIADVCETVAWADEIIVVDSDSTDRTVEIAKKYTDRIFNREFRGYKDKHEFADSLATGDWIFWIDADERVTDELCESIVRLRSASPGELADGYRIARKTFFMDRWIKHGGWYPDHQMRLYRKDRSYWDGVAPHQTARVNGPIKTLEGELLHYTKRDLSEYHRVADSYASLAAEHMATAGRRPSGWRIATAPVFAFLRTYVFKLGLLDGVPGLMIAFFTAYGVFLKNAKLWELTRIGK